MVSIFSRAELSSTKSKLFESVLDQDGVKIEYDVRVDEEQKYNEIQIFDLLVAAGYFRARIDGLDSFDKVVGGMTWCISLSNYEVDVDLLFHENSTIRHKIAITEKIVYLLPIMQCPHHLEPHQIQGLDYIHIFPVVQWLVRKAIETRKEIGNTIRSYSVFQFNKGVPTDFTTSQSNFYLNICNLQTELFPYRKFRRSMFNKELQIESKCTSIHNNGFIRGIRSHFLANPSPSLPISCSHVTRSSRNINALKILFIDQAKQLLQVLLTLLEYGQDFAFKYSQGPNFSSITTVKGREKENLFSNDKSNSQVVEMLNDFSEINCEQSSLSKDILGSIVGLQADSITQCHQTYSSHKSSSIQATSSNIRIIESLKKQVALLDKTLYTKIAIFNDILSKFHSLKNKVNNVLEEDRVLKIELDIIVSEEKHVETNLLKRLAELVYIHDQLEFHEQEFLLQCQEETLRVQNDIEMLQTVNYHGKKEFCKGLERFHEQRSIDESKYKKFRAHIAKKTRDIASLQRKIDDIPSRAELAQYQRRFVELHKFVSATLTETRQFFTLYNTLNDTQVFLSKESELLNILYDKFDTALTSQNNKNIYMKHVDQFLNETFNNLEKLEEKKGISKEEKDSLNDILVSLLDQQRQYSRLIRDFSREINHNEELVRYFSRNS